MKKRIIAILLLALLAISAAGCKSKIKTELPMKNIKSMISTEKGNLFLLTDEGLIRYHLSTDRRLVTIYSDDELTNAEFNWIDSSEEVTYTGLYIDRLLAVGSDGITFVGKYMNNTLGRNRDLFVLQDAADLGFSAGYFTELQKSKANFVSGICADNKGIFFRLNVDGADGRNFKDGQRFNFLGQSYPAKVPDGAAGVILRDNDEEKAVFLIETNKKLELVDGETVVKSYDRNGVADAFVDDDSVYAIYKDGHVTKTDIDGNEQNFLKLAGTVSEAHDALFVDGDLYWFDKDGVKTSAK